jgi:hypothetical protein
LPIDVRDFRAIHVPKAILCAGVQWILRTSRRYVRRIGEPKIGQEFVALIWLLGIGKRLASDVIYYVIVTISQMRNLNAAAVFFGGLYIRCWRSFVDRWPDIDFDIGWHLPEVFAFEQFDHSKRHVLPVLLPIPESDLF